MSEIKVFPEQDVSNVLFASRNPTEIANALAEIGVRFERWEARHDVQPGEGQDVILSAYRGHIDALMESEGYITVDVVSISADHPDKDELRQKFLSEHTHAEDEVRFFVAGHGLFSMHAGGKVYEILCEQSDLISIPANTRHWFDMGPNPGFVAIRLFNNPEGWVAHFTGNDIADHFNRLDN